MAQAYDMALAKLAIQELAALYMRGLDRLDRALLRAQFWDDAFLDYGIYIGGADSFADFCMTALEGHDSNQHMIGQHNIDLEGDEAFGEVYYQAYHKVPQESGNRHDVFVSGRYVDRYEKRDGVWKIAYRSEIVDWASDTPTTDQFLDPRMIVGKRKPDDPLYNRAAMRRKAGSSDGA